MIAGQHSPARSLNNALVPLIAAAAALAVALAVSVFYLSRPSAHNQEGDTVAPEARAYVANLQLSDVTMKASENFMKQQVVEIEGKIANRGPRPLQSVDIYCLFYGVDGHEVHREKSTIVQAKGSALKSGEVRGFRLPFDSLPEEWNQAVPKMVIAKIAFAQ